MARCEAVDDDNDCGGMQRVERWHKGPQTGSKALKLWSVLSFERRVNSIYERIFVTIIFGRFKR